MVNIAPGVAASLGVSDLQRPRKAPLKTLIRRELETKLGRLVTERGRIQRKVYALRKRLKRLYG